MGARTRKIGQNDTTRDKIKTGMIVKKLSDHINDSQKTPMTGTQVRAAECLLARTMPTLSMSDIQTTDVTENYQDMMQGLMDMADNEQDFQDACKLLNIPIVDNETNKDLN